ncbi:MAG: hypothetical protein V4520_18050 [Bacteroidota bacterium]
MKKIYSLFFILTVIGLTFSSCKKEEKKDTVVTLSVVANWKTMAVNREFFLSDQSTGVKKTLNLSDYVDHIKFNADGTGNMSVSGMVIRKFRYTSTNADIHFANVSSYNGKVWVDSPNFMFFINDLSDQELTFTQVDYDYTHQRVDDKEYDKIVTKVKIVKEN